MSIKFQRGQTLIEALLVLPVILLILFFVIYFVKYGVMTERAELALRYGLITSANTNASAYSAGNIYKTMTASTLPSPCATAAPGIFMDSSPFPGPTSAPFFQPDTAATSTCTGTTINIITPATPTTAQLATYYLPSTSVNVTAGLNIPAFLSFLGGSKQTVSSTASFRHAAWPGVLIYCSRALRNQTFSAIYGTAATPTPPPSPAPPQPVAGC